MKALSAWALMGIVGLGMGYSPRTDCPRVTAASAIVMNVETGQILYTKRIHERWPPGSLVKIMTAWLAIRYAWHKLGRVTPQAAHLGGASLGLPIGLKLPLDRLVPAMMMASGNDAAEVVATTVAGTDRAFVRKMNDTAGQWHLGTIHFGNATGLPANNQWTTAEAMARLARHVIKNPVFRAMVRATSESLWIRHVPHFYVNQNQLIGGFPGATGIKMGYTRQGGATLVATADRGHQDLIVVLLHDNLADVWPDAARLLVWGFSHDR